jgi:hypothetical protein
VRLGHHDDVYQHRVSETEAFALVRAELSRERERYIAVYGECDADTTISSADLNDKGWTIFSMAAEAIRDIASPVLLGHSPYFVDGQTGDLYLMPGRAYVSGEWWNQHHYQIQQPPPPPIQTTEQVQQLIAELGWIKAVHTLYTGTGGPGLRERRAIVKHVADGLWLTPAQRDLLRPPRPHRLAAPMTRVATPHPPQAEHMGTVQAARAAFPVAGDFHELPLSRPEAPSIRWAVRAQAGDDEAQLLSYLRAGAPLAENLTIVPDVLGPEGAIIGQLDLRTDGQWVWRSDLAFYVEHYHVAVDPRFLAHARDRRWSCPSLSPTDIDRLRRVLAEHE